MAVWTASKTRCKSLFLLAAGWMTVMTPALGQLLHPTDPRPSFEVATIKPRDPKVPVFIAAMGSQQIVVIVGTVQSLAVQAYNVSGRSRLIGGAGEADSKVYLIEAKIPDELFARMQKMTTAERRQQGQLMLQSLLADRFKLKVHFAMREMPVYDIVADKGGPKLPPPNDPSTAGAGSWAMSPQGEMRIRDMTLDGLLQSPIFGLGDRPVVNKTGLTGTYTLKLRWRPDQPTRGLEAATADDNLPSIFAALQEQLGLKLVKATDSVEVLSIDSSEPPSEN